MLEAKRGPQGNRALLRSLSTKLPQPLRPVLLLRCLAPFTSPWPLVYSISATFLWGKILSCHNNWLSVYGIYHVPDGISGNGPTCQCSRHKRLRFDPWVGKSPWSRKRQPTPVFLPGQFHGERSLAGYSPWGHKESNTTWVTEHTHTHTHTHHVPSPWYLLYLFNNTEVWSLPPRKDIKWIRGLTLWDGAVIKAGEVLSASGSGSLEEWKYIQGMPSNLLWLLLRTKGWSQWNWDWEAGWGLEVKGMSMPLPRIAN